MQGDCVNLIVISTTEISLNQISSKFCQYFCTQFAERRRKGYRRTPLNHAFISCNLFEEVITPGSFKTEETIGHLFIGSHVINL